MTTTLWRATRCTPGPVPAVVDETAALLGPAVGWLATPTALRPVRLAGTTLQTADGPASSAGAFSLRLFGPDADLRWVAAGPGVGRAVLVTETAAGLDDGWTDTAVPVVDVLDGTYALWGRRFTAATSGWCAASERRTGPLTVPAPVPDAGDGPWPAEYLCLHHREYVGVDGHGNARVVEERLTGIRTATPTTAGSERA